MPELRFPDFQSCPSWEAKSLRDLGRFFRGLTYSARDVAENGLLVLRSSNIQGGLLVLDKDLVFVGKDCPPDILLREGDVAICMSNGSKALVGKSGEYVGGHPGSATVGAFCSIFRATVPFARLAFKSEKYSRFVALAIGGGNINNLKNSDLESFLFPVPRTHDEQQKIADCLSSLDELIAARGRKVEALKAHKKGLMQQLFPQEGETVPRLRFPRFRAFGEWLEKPAGTLFRNRVESGSGGLPIYSVTMNDGLVNRSSLDRKIDDIANAEGNKKVHKYDIAYNMMRMWQGASGVAPEDCMVSPAYVVLAPGSEVHAPYFGYLFKLPQYLQLLTAHSQGLTKDRLRLYYKDFAGIPLPRPDLSEQKEIASALQSIDELILVASRKLNGLKTHKKGLMQQLFPSPEAMEA